MADFVRANWGLIVYAILLVLLVWWTWKGWRVYRMEESLAQKLGEREERQIATEAMSAGVGAAITGASIILGVIGAIAGLGKVPSGAAMHLRFAAVLCGTSLLAGVWIAANLPQYANTRNVALEPRLGVMLAVQVYSMFLGMVSLMVGAWIIFS